MISAVLSIVLYGILHEQARMRSIHPETYRAEVTLVVLLSSLAFSAITAGGVGCWCIIITHRICGPLFVMGRYLGELREGRIPTIRPLRQKDEFKNFYDNLSGVIDRLKADKQEQLSALTDVLRTATSATEGDEQSCRDALSSVAARIETMRKELADELPVGAVGPEGVSRSARSSSPVTVGVG